MQIPDQLHCLFTETLDARSDTYTIEVPKRELDQGNLEQDQSYRVALLPTPDDDSTVDADRAATETDSAQGPPVSTGEQRVVEIDDIGEQGDGIARVERGYVVIIPDTELGERVRVEMNHVKENVAFADIVERIDYYE